MYADKLFSACHLSGGQVVMLAYFDPGTVQSLSEKACILLLFTSMIVAFRCEKVLTPISASGSVVHSNEVIVRRNIGQHE